MDTDIVINTILQKYPVCNEQQFGKALAAEFPASKGISALRKAQLFALYRQRMETILRAHPELKSA